TPVEKALHVRSGKHDFGPPPGGSTSGVGEATTTNAEHRDQIMEAVHELETHSRKRRAAAQEDRESRPLPHPDSAQPNEDTTGYDFSPRANTTHVDLDFRIFKFCKNAAGGAGLSRDDTRELLDFVVQAIKNSERVNLRSLADFDQYEKAKTVEVDLSEFEKIDLRKPGDLKAVNL
ncbi:unnamed protein product, partial [Closterium sp. NIES-53]